MKRKDIFPAKVMVSDIDSVENFRSLSFDAPRPTGTRRVDRSKVVFFNNTVYIGIDTPEGPKVVFREALAEMDTVGKQVNAVTVSGKVIAAVKDENCGCGSKLKGWNPVGNIIGSTQDPQE